MPEKPSIQYAPAPARSEQFNPLVLLPTYNNARTLRDIVERSLAQHLPVLVVNDGATDDTANILNSFADRILTITHPHNLGKAAALASGFARARELAFTHTITLDTDAQLDPEQIPEFLAAAKTNPRSLIIGVRPDNLKSCPFGSLWGRRISNLFVWMESGQRVRDSQCGFRVYPLDFAQICRARAARFGFETEIITRAGWLGCDLVEIPAASRYLPPAERISHFRPWKDSLRALAMHARLFARAIAPIPHPSYGDHRTTILRFREWLSPARLWHSLRDDGVGRAELATALAVGAFIANLPIYPLQTIAAIFVARRLHLHPIAVVAGSQISTPPVNVALIGAAVAVGHAILHGKWLGFTTIHMSQFPWRTLVGPLLADWLVGSLIVGLLTSIAMFAISLGILRLVPQRQAP
jgi:uncharacterized protein (DUF2062 family)